MLPRAATEYDRKQERLQVLLERSLRRSWRKMRGRNWETAWRSQVGPEVNRLILEAQATSVGQATAYVTDVLAELNIGRPPAAEINQDAFLGVAGDGRPVDTLTYGAVVQSAQAMPATASPGASLAALASGEDWLVMAALTALSDTARAVESTGRAQHRVEGYVRMISPGACSRCVILAGRWYRTNQGFERHPNCHCRHIPASENVAGDMLTDPAAYFDSLPTAAELNERYPDLTREMRRQAGIYSQEDTFTRAGAEAIRLGADPGQVVNARRGMSTAQINPLTGKSVGRLQRRTVYGQDAYITTEGTTRRGRGYQSLNERFKNADADVKTAGQRYRRTSNVRLMPESILEVAKGPDDALRLLKLHGYLI